MSENSDSRDVAILLGTFCGGDFLAEQMSSFEWQSFANWRLFASDDGSTDSTESLLRRFQDKHGNDRVDIRRGPGRGLIANFLTLATERSIAARYYAFSDQDDIWRPDKLSRAIAYLDSIPATLPALYCSRTRLIDAGGRAIGKSPLFRRSPGFRNALVQNIAGGNTMVFNQAARDLLLRAGIVDVPAHDWWLYILVAAAGGAIFYDRYCSVDYRIHDANAIGSNKNFPARMVRLRMLLDGRFKIWNDKNIAALTTVTAGMSESSRQVLAAMCEARRQTLARRLLGMRRCGVYRQTVLGNLALVAGVILNKI